MRGPLIRAKSDGSIILTTAAGLRTFAKGQYRSAHADKPAGYDQARKQIADRQYDQAISTLEQIVKEYRYLDWDIKAQRVLAKAHLEKGDARAAINQYRKLFKMDSQASGARWGYYQALLQAGEYAILEQKLTPLIAEGSRSDAARAQIIRGDIKAARGDRKGAVLDYLRTVLLFESEKRRQPKALYKAGTALAAMRDERSKKMFGRLRDEYPDSPWAAKLR